MGIISQGILGGFSGKVGNIIGATWKGISYIRIKPVSVANPRTEGQVAQRTKFSAVLEFLQPNLAFINQGYKFHKNKQSAFNAAMSYVLHNAIGGTAPDFTVDFSNALVSRGKLLPASTTGLLMESGLATVQWVDNSTQGNARTDDRAMLLAYNPSKKESVTLLEGTPTREEITALITMPSHFVGDTVEFFLAFQSADGRTVSDSVYVGAGIVVE